MVSQQMRFTAYMFAFYDEHPHVNPDGESISTNAEGEVWYRIVDGERAHHFLQQFRKGDLAKEGDHNIWSWDGNRLNPTVRPSFLVPDYHFHCYVTNGKIEVLSDSQVKDVAVRLTWDEFMGGSELNKGQGTSGDGVLMSEKSLVCPACHSDTKRVDQIDYGVWAVMCECGWDGQTNSRNMV